MAKCKSHVWVLICTETQNGRVYKFYECANCSEPKMEIE